MKHIKLFDSATLDELIEKNNQLCNSAQQMIRVAGRCVEEKGRWDAEAQVFVRDNPNEMEVERLLERRNELQETATLMTMTREEGTNPKRKKRDEEAKTWELVVAASIQLWLCLRTSEVQKIRLHADLRREKSEVTGRTCWIYDPGMTKKLS